MNIDTVIDSRLGYIFFMISITAFCTTSIWFIRKDFAMPSKLWCLMILVYFEELVLQAVFNWYFCIPVPRPLGMLKLIPTIGISYMCFLSLTDPGKITSRLITRHLVPFVVFLLATFVVDLTYGWRPDIRTIPAYMENLHIPSIILLLLTTIYLLIYQTRVIYHLVVGYRNYCYLIRSGYRLENPIDCKSMLSLVCVLCFLCVFNIWGIVTSSEFFAITYVCIIPVLLFYFYSFGLQHIRIYSSLAESKNAAPTDEVTGSEDEMTETGNENETTGCLGKNEILKKRILKYVEERKPYLNKDLKLQDLAFAMNTNRSYISQTLNREFETNFYAFINTYRVQYSVELMKKKPGRVVEYYADKSGFKSRSVFFTEFKRVTGYTPYQYTTQIRPDEE